MHSRSFLLSCSLLTNIQHMQQDSDISSKKKKRIFAISAHLFLQIPTKLSHQSHLEGLRCCCEQQLKSNTVSHQIDTSHDFCIGKTSVSRFAKALTEQQYKRHILFYSCSYEMLPIDLHENLFTNYGMLRSMRHLVCARKQNKRCCQLLHKLLYWQRRLRG